MGIVFWDSACVTPPHRTLWLQQGGVAQTAVERAERHGRRRGRSERECMGVGRAQGISRYRAKHITTSTIVARAIYTYYVYVYYCILSARNEPICVPPPRPRGVYIECQRDDVEFRTARQRDARGHASSLRRGTAA